MPNEKQEYVMYRPSTDTLVAGQRDGVVFWTGCNEEALIFQDEYEASKFEISVKGDSGDSLSNDRNLLILPKAEVFNHTRQIGMQKVTIHVHVCRDEQFQMWISKDPAVAAQQIKESKHQEQWGASGDEYERIEVWKGDKEITNEIQP